MEDQTVSDPGPDRFKFHRQIFAVGFPTGGRSSNTSPRGELMLALPDVMENLREDMSDLDEPRLALAAAALMVSYQWQLDGKLPADLKAMWPDVQLLLTQHGYKVA